MEFQANNGDARLPGRYRAPKYMYTSEGPSNHGGGCARCVACWWPLDVASLTSGLTKGPRSALCRVCGPQALPIRSSRRNGLNGLQHTRRLDRFKRRRRVLCCAVLCLSDADAVFAQWLPLRCGVTLVSLRAGMRPGDRQLRDLCNAWGTLTSTAIRASSTLQGPERTV